MENRKLITGFDMAKGADKTEYAILDENRLLNFPISVMNDLENKLASLGKCPNCKKKFDHSEEASDTTIWFCKPCYRFYITEK